MTRAVAWWLWTALLCTLPASLPGQEDSLLRVAVRLATEGQGDSARSLVRTRLGQLDPVDSLYPEALFAAGVVADDADSARTYFRRVSIEYSSSRWADRALLRLAQLAFAAADYPAASRTARRVVMDYPLSPVRAEAGLWAGRAELELGNLEQGCRHLQEAEAAAGADVELANQVRYHLGRCTTGAAAAPPDSVRGDTAVQRDTAPRAAPLFTVQVAAVSSPAAADEVMRSLHDAGYTPHVVRDADGLFKVRVGGFTRRADAQRLATELKRKLGGNPFVVEQQP